MVSAFAQTLRRYTSLNHLAQAARAVLQNTSQINQMLSDLNRVDFANVQVNTTGLSPVTLGSVFRLSLVFVFVFFTGAGVLGVSVRRERGSASGAGL